MSYSLILRQGTDRSTFGQALDLALFVQLVQHTFDGGPADRRAQALQIGDGKGPVWTKGLDTLTRRVERAAYRYRTLLYRTFQFYAARYQSEGVR